MMGGFQLITYPVNGKCHDYIRLLVNDFSFASWVAQICLHLKNSKKNET